MPDPNASRPPWFLLERLAGIDAMREMDRQAIESIGLPGRLLMENAAGAVAGRLCEILKEKGVEGPVAVCCGGGNNGGDGYAVARLLANRGLEVTVIALGTPSGGDAKANAEVWRHFGPTLDWSKDSGPAEACLEQAAVVVDALFGTGLKRPIAGEAEGLIRGINGGNTGDSRPVIGVDIPSGIHADTGQVLGVAVQCTHTVSFQVGKPGCHQHPGAAHAGAVEVAPISIPVQWPADDPGTYRLTEAFIRAILPERPVAGHKGTFGHVLAVVGSAGMGGAASLAGRAALKIGSGLVTLGVPGCLRDRFLDDAPELMTLSSPEGTKEFFAGEQAEGMIEAASSRNATVLGCGLGRHPDTAPFVRALMEKIPTPLLIDADGLYPLNPADLQARKSPTVLTPHPGELARLAEMERESIAAERLGTARRLAKEWGVVLVLKGALTVIGDPEGRVFINPTGDAGLATGGTGDVLSGMIGGLMAQGLEPLAATLAGVYLHGLARDVQRDRISEEAFTAGDLLGGIDPALRQVIAARAG